MLHGLGRGPALSWRRSPFLSTTTGPRLPTEVGPLPRACPGRCAISLHICGTGPPSPERLLGLLQLSGNQISARLDVLSYFFLIPTGVGLFVFLRDRKPALALTGGAFFAFSLVGFFLATTMNLSMMSLAQGPVTEALKERLAAINTIHRGARSGKSHRRVLPTRRSQLVRDRRRGGRAK